MKAKKKLPVARRVVELPENHVWADGPDGSDYHCMICNVSRCDDWSGSTCLDWLNKKMRDAKAGQIYWR